MRMRAMLLVLSTCLGSIAEGQVCSAPQSEIPANANADTIAAANVRILFNGIELSAEQRLKAIEIYADAWRALLKLDYKASDFQDTFTAILAKRNEKLLTLTPTTAGKAKLEACFKKMNQPTSTGSLRKPPLY